MARIPQPHAGHFEHLCYKVNMGALTSDFSEYKKLVKNPKFVCRSCGRSAASSRNLCNPKKL
jgi:hypothetical protein